MPVRAATARPPAVSVGAMTPFEILGAQLVELAHTLHVNGKLDEVFRLGVEENVCIRIHIFGNTFNWKGWEGIRIVCNRVKRLHKALENVVAIPRFLRTSRVTCEHRGKARTPGKEHRTMLKRE